MQPDGCWSVGIFIFERGTTLNNNHIHIRPETPQDYHAVELLTREAFWDVYNPGAEEHFIVHNLRNTDAFIPELSLVACDGEQLIGHILYSRSHVFDAQDNAHEMISFGPISVLPAYQGQGIGSALINRTIDMAKNMGFRGIFILGNPKYYHRFGFVNAKQFHITMADGKNFDEFMGLALAKNSLAGIHGRLVYHAAFEVDKAALALYEQNFPPKETTNK
jgi:predicted N-acetyltransferase YhbS